MLLRGSSGQKMRWDLIIDLPRRLLALRCYPKLVHDNPIAETPLTSNPNEVCPSEMND